MDNNGKNLDLASVEIETEVQQVTETSVDAPNNETLKIKQETLDHLASWYWEMEEAKQGLKDPRKRADRVMKKIYETRQAWCKILHSWVSGLDDFWFSEKYKNPGEGQELVKCIFYINNKLFNEARNIVLRGQEVIGRWEVEGQSLEASTEEEDSYIDKAIASCMRWSHILEKNQGNELQNAMEDLKMLKFWLRVQETLWVYQSCKLLDSDADEETPRGTGATDIMAHRDAEVDKLCNAYTFEQVMTSDEFWREVNHQMYHADTGDLEAHELQDASERGHGEGVIDTKELENGLVKLSWFHFFYCDCVSSDEHGASKGSLFNFSKLSTKAFDLTSLPGWNRAYPAGPARVFDWLKLMRQKKQSVKDQGTSTDPKEVALLNVASSFFDRENSKSLFPMPLEVMVHRMLEVRLKEAVILLGRRLEGQGSLAVPACRWLTNDDVQQMEYKYLRKQTPDNQTGGHDEQSPEEKLLDMEMRFPDDLFTVEKIALHQAGFIFQAYKVRQEGLHGDSCLTAYLSPRLTTGTSNLWTC